MMNDDFVWQSAAALTERAGSDLEQAYLLTLSRKPTPQERDFAATYLQSGGFKTLAQALLSSNEFLYID